MPCVILLLLFGMPRVALLAVWLFNPAFLNNAFATIIWPLLGFFVAPLTTLAWAWAKNTYGAVEGLGLAAVVVAAVIDLGLIGASRRKRKD